MLCKRSALAGKREEAQPHNYKKASAPASGAGGCKGIHLLRLRARDGSFGGMDKLPDQLGRESVLCRRSALFPLPLLVKRAKDKICE